MKCLLSVALVTLCCMQSAVASDPFVEAITPCLESFQSTPSPSDADAARYRIELGQGWTAGLFAIPAEDGGGLGSDLCGDLSDAAMRFADGRYTWPTSLGERRAVFLDMVTPIWLEMILRNARAAQGGTDAGVHSVSITALPDGHNHLVRVHFAAAEAEAERSLSVDLDAGGTVLARHPDVPDQFPRMAQTDMVASPRAEGMAAPTIDPPEALRMLWANTGAASDAQIVRLTLSSFAAGLVYRNGASAPIRQTQFNFVGGAASGMTDDAFEFPGAFKACAMTRSQVEKAVGNVVKQKRYQASAARLQHLLLECSDDKPKPHFSLVALEPFEYFDLPATF